MLYGGQPLTTLATLSREKAVHVAYLATLACLRLFRLGWAYLDLKPANVLYLGRSFNDMQLSLCDYGGLALLGAADGVATYPPPEFPYGTDVRATERAVVYGLGVLLVCLFTDGEESHLGRLGEPHFNLIFIYLYISYLFYL
jgi:hypothetical protein